MMQKNANRAGKGMGSMVFKEAKRLFEEVWEYIAPTQTKRNETHDLYIECQRLRSADELVKRLQGENGRLKSEVQDLKSR